MPYTRNGRSDLAETGDSEQQIAIVGMACKFPGARDLDAFWKLLAEGENTVTEGIPGSAGERLDRLFTELEGKNETCRFGAFVDDIEQFDAAFFRISPVEAELLDPQQRMMLETSWLALEDAGIDPGRLRGSRTGVYTGISNDEYRMLVLESDRPTEAAESLYALSGTNLNGTSGRVSYVLGLTGPAKAIDAACASSLVAVHDAVADLQQGKSDLGIVGGVQAILNSRVYELRADAMMLSPDGQCKTFDASADGYVRGEGCGVVVLKRLSEAEADGDRIWAVIRGSAVNHGGTGTGLTVPNTPALEQVMETAMAAAGVSPSQIEYLEAHGTGTAVGDPIEVSAVANVFGPGRAADHPLLIGSVKTNIGHLECAAGIAGLIKTALVVERGVIPAHLHFRNPNPSIDWDSLPLRVTSDMMDWPNGRGGTGSRMAGVNSFGLSGTNACIVVAEHGRPDDEPSRSRGQRMSGAARVIKPSMPEPEADIPLQEEALSERRIRILPLSGKPGGALRELAERYLSWLDDRSAELASESSASKPTLSDMAWTAAVGRSHFEHRAGVVFHDAESLRKQLGALAGAGGAAVEPAEPNASAPAAVAFAYTGQGSQWIGMGRDLYETEPAARAILDRCEAVFREERGASLLDVMFGQNGAVGDLGDTAWEQPALYALECALTALWASVGVRPSVVLGHSVGELAAAQAAGVFSLEDGMRFAVMRGSLLSGTEPGAMAAVFAPARHVAPVVEAVNAASVGVGLSISADNGAHQVISGTAEDIETIVKRFASEGIRTRRLNTTRAFHSALVEPALDELEAFLGDVAVKAPTIAVISNLTGQRLEPGMAMDGLYWRRHAREAVAWAGGVRALADLQVDMVVEIGPHAVLGPMTALAWPEPLPGLNVSRVPVMVASMRRPHRDEFASQPESSFANAVAEAYEAGLDIDFKGLFSGESRRRVSLPGYPFQRQRHWLEPTRRRRLNIGHPLLGVRYESARGEITYETELFPSDPAWLRDHRVFGRVIAPGALYGAMAAAASLAEEGHTDNDPAAGGNPAGGNPAGGNPAGSNPAGSNPAGSNPAGSNTAGGNPAAIGSVGGALMAMEDMQLHSALVFPEEDPDARNGTGAGEDGRTVQVVLDAPDQASWRRVQIFSRGTESEWTLHVEGRVRPGGPSPDIEAESEAEAESETDGRVDLEELKARLSPASVSDYYRSKADTGINLGPSLRTLGRVWAGRGRGRGIPARGCGSQQAGCASAAAGRMLPSGGRGAQHGRQPWRGHLSAIRLAGVAACRAAARPCGLPCTHERRVPGRDASLRGN